MLKLKQVKKLIGVSSLETVIKRIVGECDFVSEQEFRSLQDAGNDRNPISQHKVTVADYKMTNVKYRLKKEDKNVRTV